MYRMMILVFLAALTVVSASPRGDGVSADVSADISASVSADVDASLSADVSASVSADVDASLSADVSASLSADVDASLSAEVGASISADVDASLSADVSASLSAGVDASLSADISASVSAGVDISASISEDLGNFVDVEFSVSDDSEVFLTQMEWSDTCDCMLRDNDYYDDILYMYRRYQDFTCVQDFYNYVMKETDEVRRNYVTDGADNQTTANENVRAFDRLRLRPRVLRGVGEPDTTTQLLGDSTTFPLGIAPISQLEWLHPDGEIGVAQAAECEGVPYIVSAFSNTDLEEIARRAPHANLWMETYIFFDRSITQSIVERAENVGYRAIVVNVAGITHPSLVRSAHDHVVLPDYLHYPNIENDESNEHFGSGSDDIRIGNDIDGDRIRDKVHNHHILSQIELVKGKGFFKTQKVDQKYERISRCIGSFTLENYHEYLVDNRQSWDDFRWIRKTTSLPIVAKGILTGCDAIRAVENGANAIIVSNNGGRTVDTAASALEALAEVLEAVDVYQNVQVYVDGGVRWGTDIFKALAIGADAVFIGRPISWASLHSGKCGSRRVLQILRREFERTMEFMGTKYVDEITSTMVVSENYYRHRYRPDDVDARNNARESRLECPFGYDYDEDGAEIALTDVNVLQPALVRYKTVDGGYNKRQWPLL